MQELNNYQLSLVARSFVEQQLQLVYHPQDWWEKKAYIDPQIYPKIDGVEIELNKESARTFINVNKRKEGGGGVVGAHLQVPAFSVLSFHNFLQPVLAGFL